jgi:hypothetical protein
MNIAQFLLVRLITIHFLKVWILASTDGELLACQPYGGASTHIPDYGLGQGPNVILGLSEQYGLLPGSKVHFSAVNKVPKIFYLSFVFDSVQSFMRLYFLGLL